MTLQPPPFCRPPSGAPFIVTNLAVDPPPRPEPTILRRTDDRGLLYVGKVNALVGEPGGGKSWLALLAMAELARAGVPSLYVDAEDDAGTATQRLVDLGLDAGERSLVHHLRLEGSLTDSHVEWLVAEVDRAGAGLVVVDALAEVLQFQDMDENVAGDVTAWHGQVGFPLARTGAAVLLVDHLPKAEDVRRQGGRGSSAKLALISGAAYRIDVEAAWDMETAGQARVVCLKDRGGRCARDSAVAVAHFEPGYDGALEVRLEPPATEVARAAERGPSLLAAMEAVSRLAEERSTEWLRDWDFRTLEGPFPRRLLPEARAKLVEGGHIEAQTGPRGGEQWRHARPYRQDLPDEASDWEAELDTWARGEGDDR